MAQEKDKEAKLHGMVFVINVILGIIAALVGMLLLLNIQNMFSNTMTILEIQKARIMFAILIFNLLITIPFNMFGNIIAAYEKFIFGKIIKILQIILMPIISIPILIMGYKSLLLVIITTLVNLLCLSLNTWYSFKKLDIKLKFKNFDKQILKTVLKYSVFIFFCDIAGKLYWNVNQFVLGAFNSTTAIAIYSVALQLNIAYVAFSGAISNVLLPKISMMEEKGAADEEFTDVFIKTGRIQYLLMGLIITGFILFGKYFIHIWVGKAYRTSYYVACILMVPATITLIQGVGINIMQAKNKHGFRAISTFLMAITNIVFSALVAKKYGAVGVAIPTAISLILCQGIAMNIYYQKVIRINIVRFWKEILKVSFAVIISLLLGIILNKFINNTNIFIYLFKIGIYTLTYCGLSWRLSMNKYEKRLIQKPIDTILRRRE